MLVSEGTETDPILLDHIVSWILKFKSVLVLEAGKVRE